MKKLLSLFAILLIMVSCQDEEEQEIVTEYEVEKVVDSIPTLTGEFIYVADAGVFRGRDFVYGVKIDSMAQVLADEVQPYKKEDFDMVKVRIKGKIETGRRQDGWKEVVEIREILEILQEGKTSETNN
ncbi:hypothetical protein RM545_02985 [Zunongwangia sp. F260]|uniref:NlpE C-terminal OB domain-containing protein n=1 Tax=Autumnicola lenta TaxID=3075593 RepID=A0ABU3CH20_9FLAO|nr:hypothetical protein [Zunongwangia sp. F260]MDT0645644.1 hypothetical protein [Zunongwangia sp. F260]